MHVDERWSFLQIVVVTRRILGTKVKTSYTASIKKSTHTRDESRIRPSNRSISSSSACSRAAAVFLVISKLCCRFSTRSLRKIINHRCEFPKRALMSLTRDPPQCQGENRPSGWDLTREIVPGASLNGSLYTKLMQASHKPVVFVRET